METKKHKYLMNTWYVAALSTEVEAEGLFKRTLLETPVVLYRKTDGAPVALHDRCPHRFVPLSMGTRDGDSVVCPYHGLTFDCSGKCTKNPHGNQKVPAAAQVKSFPLLERHGFIWIWMGDQPPEEGALPDFGTLDVGPASAIAYTHMEWPCYYELITDNVMDLSHVDHVHGEIITTRGQLSPMIPSLEEKNGTVAVQWNWSQMPPMLIFNDFLPNPGKEARHFVRVTWSPPTNLQLTVGVTQDEAAPLDFANTIAQYDLHSCTPQDTDTTHYFFATRRNHVEDDAEYNEIKLKAMHGAFVNEDGPILKAVHESMGTTDFFSLNPVLISSDSGPVRVRRILKKLIEDEQNS